MEAVVIGLKVVGTVFMAKTMIDGLKYGNLLKAVLGGVGAYIGMTSLMTPAAAGTTAESGAISASAGTQAAPIVEHSFNAGMGTTASNAAINGATEGLTAGGGLLGNAASTFDISGVGNAANAATPAMSGVVQNTLPEWTQPAAGAASTAAPTSFAQSILEQGKGLLGGTWKFVTDKSNAPIVAGLLQGVGAWAQNQDVMDWKTSQIERDRALRGAVPSGVTQYRFDPVSRSMVKVTG